MHNAHVLEYYRWEMWLAIWRLPPVMEPIEVDYLNCMP